MDRIIAVAIGVLSIVHLHAQNDGFVLNGSAVDLGGDCYRLTAQVNNLVGSIWNETQINLNEPFEALMEIELGSNDDPGADGMVFGFQPVSTSIGSVGQGIGFEGVSPSLGIEFDTYANGVYADPSFDHIAIISDGVMSHDVATNLAGPAPILSSSPNAEDGQSHLVRVVWEPSITRLEVYVDCDLRVSYVGDIVNDIFGGDPMVYWGFTAATGGENNLHQVCLTYLTFLNALEDQSICTGDEVQLEINGGTTYDWTPTAGLSDPTIGNPVASPTVTTEYVVAVTDECGRVFFDSLIIDVAGTPIDATLIPDTLLCDTEDWIVTLNVPTGTDALWSDNSTLLTRNLNAPGSYTVELTNGNCAQSLSTEVTTAPPPTIDFGADTTLCEGTPLVLDATTSAVRYLWEDGTTEPMRTITEGGTYSVTATLSGCTDSDDITVAFAPVPTLELDSTAFICDGEVVDIDILPEPGVTYTWQDGSTSPQYSIALPGTYTLTAALGDCITQASIDVTTLCAPDISLGSDTTICASTPLILSAFDSLAVGYVWQDGSTRDTFRVTESGFYAVQAFNECGTAFGDIQVLVDDCRSLYIPTAFSPNGDGVNDEFRFYQDGDVVSIVQWRIYNRLGGEVFEIDRADPDALGAAWDGNHNGRPVAADTYTWWAEVEYKDGFVTVLTGDVTVVR